MWWLRAQPMHSSGSEAPAGGGSAMSRAAATDPAPLRLRRAGGQLLGEREVQEDELGFIDGPTLDPGGQHPVVVVADGMGGHASGELASRLAVRAFIEAYGTEGRPADRLRAALDRANQAIDDAIRDNLSLDGMGTTLVAAAITADGLEWVSVGDSPLYLCRDGWLKRLNEDHSMAPVIAALREIDPATARGMNPNELRSALVGFALTRVDASPMPELLRPGDLILLASDGLNTLDEGEMASLIVSASRGDGPEAVKDALLAAVAAQDAPTQDNVTVALIEAPGATGAAGAARDVPGATGRPACRKHRESEKRMSNVTRSSSPRRIVRIGVAACIVLGVAWDAVPAQPGASTVDEDMVRAVATAAEIAAQRDTEARQAQAAANAALEEAAEARARAAAALERAQALEAQANATQAERDAARAEAEALRAEAAEKETARVALEQRGRYAALEQVRDGPGAGGDSRSAVGGGATAVLPGPRRRHHWRCSR